MSTTPTRPPAVPSPTPSCAADGSTPACSHTQSLQDPAPVAFPSGNQPAQAATAPEQKALTDAQLDELAQLLHRLGHFQVVLDTGQVVRARLAATEGNSFLLDRLSRRIPELGLSPQPKPRETFDDFIRKHHATAAVEEFAAAIQALTVCAGVRIHAAHSQAAGKTGGIGSERFDALLSVEFWNNVAFNLDMLHGRFLAELERRDERRRFLEQQRRQEVTR